VAADVDQQPAPRVRRSILDCAIRQVSAILRTKLRKGGGCIDRARDIARLDDHAVFIRVDGICFRRKCGVLPETCLHVIYGGRRLAQRKHGEHALTRAFQRRNKHRSRAAKGDTALTYLLILNLRNRHTVCPPVCSVASFICPMQFSLYPARGLTATPLW